MTEPQVVYVERAEPRNAPATTGLVLGLIGATLALIASFASVLLFLWIPAVILGVLAFVFGAIGLTRSNKVDVGKNASLFALLLAVVAMGLPFVL